MSIPRNFWAKFWRVSARARAKYFTRFLGMYWSIQISFLCCYDQNQQPPFFSHLLFCCYLWPQQKNVPKCCPTIKERFLFKKIFSKSISNVSKYKKVTFVTGGGVNSVMTSVFASYEKYFEVTHKNLQKLSLR